MDCVFCGIVRSGEGDIVYQDEATVAFMDINPATRGHLLVVPRAHRRNIWEMGEEEARAVMATAWRLAGMVRAALRPEGLNLVHASGAAAFQDVSHFHLHVIPRYPGDVIVRPWESVPGDSAQIREVADSIRAVDL